MIKIPDSGAEPFTATIKESCRRTGLSRSKLYELMKDGRLTPIKIGRRTLLSTDELRRLVSPEQRSAA